MKRCLWFVTMLFAVFLAGCNAILQPSGSVAPGSREGPTPGLSQTNQSAQGAPKGRTSGASQTNEGGQVTVQVSWTVAGDSLRFTIAMNTHSVDLDGYDLSQLAVLRNDRGQELQPKAWDAPAGGHHRQGTLTFPLVDGSGRSVLDGANSLELVVRAVAGVPERIFRWSLA